MTQRLTYWYPAICVAILISVFSTHAFSGDQTAHIIIPDTCDGCCHLPACTRCG